MHATHRAAASTGAQWSAGKGWGAEEERQRAVAETGPRPVGWEDKQRMEKGCLGD